MLAHSTVLVKEGTPRTAHADQQPNRYIWPGHQGLQATQAQYKAMRGQQRTLLQTCINRLLMPKNSCLLPNPNPKAVQAYAPVPHMLCVCHQGHVYGSVIHHSKQPYPPITCRRQHHFTHSWQPHNTSIPYTTSHAPVHERRQARAARQPEDPAKSRPSPTAAAVAAAVLGAAAVASHAWPWPMCPAPYQHWPPSPAAHTAHLPLASAPAAVLAAQQQQA